MKPMTILKAPRAELNSFTPDPYAEKILSQDKKFCSTILGFISSLKNRKPVGQNLLLCTLYFHTVR